MSVSGVQVISGQDEALVRMFFALHLRDSEIFDLGSVLHKNSDELPVVEVSFDRMLSIQEGSLSYPAPFGISAVPHNEVDVAISTNSRLLGSGSARAALGVSAVQILRGQDNTEQGNMAALQLHNRNTLNFSSVLFKNREELIMTRVFFSNALLVRKGDIRHSAFLRFAAGFHKEMHAIADNDSHSLDPRISAIFTNGGWSAPHKRVRHHG